MRRVASPGVDEEIRKRRQGAQLQVLEHNLKREGAQGQLEAAVGSGTAVTTASRAMRVELAYVGGCYCCCHGHGFLNGMRT